MRKILSRFNNDIQRREIERKRRDALRTFRHSSCTKTGCIHGAPKKMSIQVIEAPHEFHKPAVFLGGSISAAADWQSDFIEALGEFDVDMVALNPRRESFDVSDHKLTDKQIAWEYRHLRRADVIVFYFSHETLAPITLLEFGAHTHSSGKPIFVGIHPDYGRRRDVEVQCKLIRPDIQIVYNVGALASQVYGWYSDFMRSL